MRVHSTREFTVFYIALCVITVVNGQRTCARIAEDPTSPQCCLEPKPLSCLFKPAKDQHKPPCDCVPKKFKTDSEQLCMWNSFYSTRTDDNKYTVSCKGLERKCTNVITIEDPVQEKQIACSMSKDTEYIYPMRYESMKDVKDYMRTYCQLSKEEKAHKMLDEMEFYNTIFTCWIHDCDIRLQKIKPNRQDKPLPIGTVNPWCYPPILHSESKLKYCELYELSHSIYIQPRDNGFDPSKYSHIPCVLPPLCSTNGKIDKSHFMIPLVNGKADDTYCERVCPLEHNVGYYKDESGSTHNCRRRPTCGIDDKYKVNLPHLPFSKSKNCLEWCSSTDSYLRDPTQRKEKKGCNNLPVCNKDGKIPEPFSLENPFGLPITSKDPLCIERRDCNGDERSSTHFCSLDKVEDVQKNEEVVVVASVGIVLLIIFIVGLVILALFLIRRKRSKKEDNKESLVETAVEIPATPTSVVNTESPDWKAITHGPRMKDSTQGPRLKESAIANPNSATRSKTANSTSNVVSPNWEISPVLAAELKESPQKRKHSRAKIDSTDRTYDNVTFPSQMAQ